MTYSDKKSVYEGRFLLNRSCNFDIKLTTNYRLSTGVNII